LRKQSMYTHYKQGALLVQWRENTKTTCNCQYQITINYIKQVWHEHNIIAHNNVWSHLWTFYSLEQQNLLIISLGTCIKYFQFILYF
jgi:hypothetical protein